MSQIEKLFANPLPLDSAEEIRKIVMFLQRSEDLSKHIDYFMKILSLLHSEDVVQFVLTPILSEELCESNFLRFRRFFSVIFFWR